jgi:DNA-binding CsgD family transcriptional regulator
MVVGRMTTAIIGRDDELASVHAFVDGVWEGPSALVLEGEAGIGKSTLWLAGVEYARNRGLRVLSARPAEAERTLAHVGLADLFEDVRDHVLPALTPPRRRALEVALLVEEATEAVEPGALGIATRDALHLLAEGGPLVVAIDDLQWFDPSSGNALSFAARRLGATPVSLLVARRLAGEAQPSALEQALGAAGVRRLPVGPLTVGALHRFLLDRLDRPFARQTLLRIHERSRGNPLLAVELARYLDEDARAARSLHVPETLEELLRARISGLPAATRSALALASAFGTASVSLLLRAGAEARALQSAVSAHVIELDGDAIRFTHPLLSAVVYQDLGDERRLVHRRIAELVDDPLLHARHLALSQDEPDADVAAALEDAVGLATRRGASAVAAELAEQAQRLTPAEEHGLRHRRGLAAARAHSAAGEWPRARAIAAELLDETDDVSLRADALILLAELESVDRAVVLLEEALGEAAPRPELQSELHCRLAWATRFRTGYVRALKHGRQALALADRLEDDVLRARARSVLALLGWMVGDADAPQLPSSARDFATALGGERPVQEATLAFVNTFAPAARREEARALLESEYREWRERDELRGARALWGLAWIEFFAGRWALAEEHAIEAHELAIQYGLEVPQNHLPIALVAVHRGELELAREHSERALALAEEQLGLHPPQHLAILGLVAFWSGDATEAERRLAAADRQAAALGWGEPSIRWWSADHVELLVGLDRLDDAVQALDVWEADAARLGREWVLAHVARCRGLVAGARGDNQEALHGLDRAVAEHEVVGDPFGRARALLALGTVRRRDRQKRAAREAIEAALAGFETLGAAGWAQRARAELGRVGGRKPGGGELTPTERRLADLVAEGRSNREIAAALFVTPKSVGTALSRLYAKVGVHSRTELLRRLAEKPPSKV